MQMMNNEITVDDDTYLCMMNDCNHDRWVVGRGSKRDREWERDSEWDKRLAGIYCRRLYIALVYMKRRVYAHTYKQASICTKRTGVRWLRTHVRKRDILADTNELKRSRGKKRNICMHEWVKLRGQTEERERGMYMCVRVRDKLALSFSVV